MQAETEVTAEKRSALPLARVTATLLPNIESFGDFFWSKFCQRVGGWAIPIVVPKHDITGAPLDDAAHRKMRGYREDESFSEYLARVTGIMRVYFAILAMPVEGQMESRWRMGRVWTYLARMTSSPELLDSAVGAEIIYSMFYHQLSSVYTHFGVLAVAIDVLGALAMEYFGYQWIKLMTIIYDGCTTGMEGGRLIGGTSPEGTASRVRIQVEIEKLMFMN